MPNGKGWVKEEIGRGTRRPLGGEDSKEGGKKKTAYQNQLIKKQESVGKIKDAASNQIWGVVGKKEQKREKKHFGKGERSEIGERGGQRVFRKKQKR